MFTKSIRNAIGRNYRYRRAIEAVHSGRFLAAAGNAFLAAAEYRLILASAAQARSSYAGALDAWSFVERY